MTTKHSMSDGVLTRQEPDRLEYRVAMTVPLGCVGLLAVFFLLYLVFGTGAGGDSGAVFAVIGQALGAPFFMLGVAPPFDLGATLLVVFGVVLLYFFRGRLIIRWEQPGRLVVTGRTLFRTRSKAYDRSEFTRIQYGALQEQKERIGRRPSPPRWVWFVWLAGPDGVAIADFHTAHWLTDPSDWDLRHPPQEQATLLRWLAKNTGIQPEGPLLVPKMDD